MEEVVKILQNESKKCIDWFRVDCDKGFQMWRPNTFSF